MSAPGSSVMSGASRWLAPSAPPAPSASAMPASTRRSFQDLVFIAVSPSFGGLRRPQHGSPAVRERVWNRVGPDGMNPDAAPISYWQPLKGCAAELKLSPEAGEGERSDTWSACIARAAEGDAGALAELYD